jgi:hypothetical protein
MLFIRENYPKAQQFTFLEDKFKLPTPYNLTWRHPHDISSCFTMFKLIILQPSSGAPYSYKAL